MLSKEQIKLFEKKGGKKEDYNFVDKLFSMFN